MYDYFRGRVARKTPTSVILDVGGVGYLLETSVRTSSSMRQGAEATVLVQMRQSEADDKPRLFGFADDTERDLFRNLLKIAGVGPSHALALLSAFDPDQIWAALRDGDQKKLMSSKGIGPKIAQRLVVELKDEAQKRAGAGRDTQGTGDGASGADDVVEALVVLGYSDVAALKAAQGARKRLGADAPIDALIRESLKGGA